LTGTVGQTDREPGVRYQSVMPVPLAGRSDADIVAALRAGDERTFAALVDGYSPTLIRVAMAYVPSRAVAEEVVQETWLAVMRGLDGFEGRSSLKTWVIRILTNLALRGGAREGRSVPFSSLEAEGPSVEADRFLPAGHDRWPGHWVLAPAAWPTPDEGLLAGETRAVIVEAIDALPAAQRIVITLRDIGGWPSEDVSDALGVSAGNQRVLLHRARTKVRAAIERYHGAVQDLRPLMDRVTPEPPGRTARKSR